MKFRVIGGDVTLFTGEVRTEANYERRAVEAESSRFPNLSYPLARMGCARHDEPTGRRRAKTG